MEFELEIISDLKENLQELKSQLDDKFNELLTLYRIFPQESVTNVRGEVIDRKELNKLLENYSNVIKENIINFDKQYDGIFHNVITRCKPNFIWDMEELNESEFIFLSGNDPWNFILRKKSTECIDISNFISFLSRYNELKKVAYSLAIGDIAICPVSDNYMARGMYLGTETTGKFLFYDIDRGVNFYHDLDNLYAVPQLLMRVPPQAIICTLTKDSYCKKYWPIELNSFFETFMSKNPVIYRVLEMISLKYPPKYLVNILIMRENGETISLNDWFKEMLVPCLRATLGDKGELKAFLKDPFEWEDQKIDSTFRDAITNSLNDETVSVEKEDNRLSLAIQNLFVTNNPESVNTFDLNLDVDREINDEVPTCKFYRENGHCWKDNCTREHVGPVGPGYVGSAYAYDRAEQLLDVPVRGETIRIKPTAFDNGHIFYSHLIENNVPFKLNLKMIEKRMNNKEESARFQHLDLLPAFGEIVLANGANKLWYRGRIVDVSDHTAKVFNVDYGSTEQVPLNNLRKINIDLLYLPFQALRCVLPQTCSVRRRFREARLFTESLIKDQILTAVVNYSQPLEACIEPIITLPDGRNLEEVLWEMDVLFVRL